MAAKRDDAGNAPKRREASERRCPHGFLLSSVECLVCTRLSPTREAAKADANANADANIANVLALCEDEFEQTWGERWLSHTGLSQWLIGQCEAALANHRTECEARALYERLRKRTTLVRDEARTFFADPDHPLGAGGFAVAALNSIVCCQRELTGSELLPLGELRDSIPSGHMIRETVDGFSGVIWRLFEYSSRPPLSLHLQDRELKNREAAVIAILFGVVLDSINWGPYERRVQPGESLAPLVIRETATRVRHIVGPDMPGANRPR